MSEIKLLNCPCCNGKAKLCDEEYLRGHFVFCTECGLQTKLYVTGNTIEKAVSDWNTRKPMERIIERLNGKKKTLCGTYDFYTKPLDRPSCKIAFNNGICESIEVIKEEGGIE